MSLTDAPSVVINVDKICTTSIIISLNTHSHPACGDVSHNVTISGNAIYPDIDGGCKYTIDGLQSDTLYNITVTSTYNSGSRIVYRSVRTSLPKHKFSLTLHNDPLDTNNCISCLRILCYVLILCTYHVRFSSGCYIFLYNS